LGAFCSDSLACFFHEMAAMFLELMMAFKQENEEEKRDKAFIKKANTFPEVLSWL
jgi:hypothetical protein